MKRHRVSPYYYKIFSLYNDNDYTLTKYLLLRGLPHGSSLLVSALMTSSDGRGHVGNATLHWLAADVSPAHIPMKAAYWYFDLGLFMSVQATGALVWGLKLLFFF